MAPCLENCPNEIIENVVLLLDLEDVRSLRQISRSLAVKCTGHRFKSFFLSKRVELTEPMLRTFAEVTQPGRLGCLIQEMTLIGVASVVNGSNLGMQEISRAEKIELLSQVFSGLRTNSVTRRLPSLSLEVVVVSNAGERLLPVDAEARRSHNDFGPSWKVRKLVRQCARDTFGTAWYAIAASSLPIERLNIFNSDQMQRCSLASDSLGEVDWGNPGLATSFASLRSLSVSLCNKDINPRESREKEKAKDVNGLGSNDDGPSSPKLRDQNDLRAEAEDEGNFLGLAKLLRLCGQLDYFEIHYFRSSIHSLTQEEHHHERLLQRVAEMDRLPMIQQCSLRGVFTMEQHLLAFVQRTGVCKLSMENIHLGLGTFRSIFDYCQSETTSVEAVYFDDLFEQPDRWRIIYFDAPGERKFPHTAHPNGCVTLERTGAEVKQPISYHVPDGRPVGSPSTVQWVQDRHREYGPR